MLNDYTQEQAVCEWEKTKNNNNRIRSKKVRNLALRIAEININEQRGVTREDINYKLKKDHKRGIIYRLLERGIILPLPERNKRLKQYVLSNLYDEFADLDNKRFGGGGGSSNNNKTQDQDFDYGLIDRIAEYFSREKPGLHNIHIQTSTTKENYEILKDWDCNDSNKGKTKDFRLEVKRQFAITVYPNGTILIVIGCNTKPFRLHDSNELIGFFSSLGEIRKTLSSELKNNISAVPPASEWWLTQYDIDNTIAADMLQKEFSKVNVSSSLRNNIPIRLFGHLFYCYLKPMPNIGASIRFEERVFPDDKPLNKEIKNVLDSIPPFKKAIDLLKEKKDMTS